MEFPIAQDYLLLTEKITQRPQLRTRFTTQAYLVLAAFLDLRYQGLITLTSQRVAIPDAQELAAALPTSLQELARRLADQLTRSDQTADVFKLLVSWDLANAVYDTVGPMVLEQHQAERVIFQNNLLPHTIYEPTPAARQAVVDRLERAVTQRQLTTTATDLLALFEQLDALPWLFASQVQPRVVAQLHDQREYPAVHGLTELAAHRITMRKFELDSWLS